MKLITMIDFVLQEEKKGMQNTDRHLRFEKILKYAKFLNQPLKLEMFVACDDNGNVLEEPVWQQEYDKMKVSNPSLIQKSKEYDKAKEKVLFEGFRILSNEDNIIELKRNDIFINYDKEEEDLFFIDSWNDDYVIMNIESLSNFIINTVSSITLTKNAIKQFM